MPTRGCVEITILGAAQSEPIIESDSAQACIFFMRHLDSLIPFVILCDGVSTPAQKEQMKKSV